MSFIRLITVIVAAIIGAARPSLAATTPEGKSTSSISLTYIANDGVLIVGSHEKVLIDSIYTVSYGIFELPKPEVFVKIKAAAAPFDKLTCLLVTHADTDHFTAPETMELLLNDPAVAFFGPQQVVQKLQGLPSFDQIKSRVFAAAQTGASTEQRVGADLGIRAIPLEHLSRPSTMPTAPYNVGHLFTIDGIKFLHAGDMGPQNLEAFKRAKLREEQVDVAIVGFYFFGDATVEAAREMLTYLNPKVVLLAHLTIQGHANEAARVMQLPGMPRIIPLDTLMQEFSISKAGTELQVVKK